ncbi:hypothetical protein NPIL_180071 [Nephila pilipes]|uniref:Uncharacterized protein n=1 Tax=Nephila pilipes TaxID=299642 RepID=A0A8X6TX74_NEPPI|nr:hypothetical protein NPIL_180071 [Nephila pilipes]
MKKNEIVRSLWLQEPAHIGRNDRMPGDSILLDRREFPTERYFMSLKSSKWRIDQRSIAFVLLGCIESQYSANSSDSCLIFSSFNNFKGIIVEEPFICLSQIIFSAMLSLNLFYVAKLRQQLVKKLILDGDNIDRTNNLQMSNRSRINVSICASQIDPNESLRIPQGHVNCQ